MQTTSPIPHRWRALKWLVALIAIPAAAVLAWPMLLLLPVALFALLFAAPMMSARSETPELDDSSPGVAGRELHHAR